MKAEVRADLLYREWEYRHGVVWKTVQLWGAASILATGTPFLAHAPKMGNAILLTFPLVGLLLALIGGWNISSEYARLRVLYTEYEEVRTPLPRIAESSNRKVSDAFVSARVGSILSRLFLCALTSLAIVAELMLIRSSFEMSRGWSVGLIWISIGCLVLGVIGCLAPVSDEIQKRKQPKT